MSFDTSKYRPIEETYPFFDATAPDGDIIEINAFAIAAFRSHKETNGTMYRFNGLEVLSQVKDDKETFGKRLRETLNFGETDPYEQVSGMTEEAADTRLTLDEINFLRDRIRESMTAPPEAPADATTETKTKGKK